MRTLIGLSVLLALQGCATTETRTFREPTLPSLPTRWAVGMTPERVRALTPEEAKAVLIAQAYLEASAKDARELRPEILEFRPTRIDRGWSVYVGFVGFWNDDEPQGGIGYFCTVHISENWEVTSVVGGA